MQGEERKCTTEHTYHHITNPRSPPSLQAHLLLSPQAHLALHFQEYSLQYLRVHLPLQLQCPLGNLSSMNDGLSLWEHRNFTYLDNHCSESAKTGTNRQLALYIYLDSIPSLFYTELVTIQRVEGEQKSARFMDSHSNFQLPQIWSD